MRWDARQQGSRVARFRSLFRSPFTCSLSYATDVWIVNLGLYLVGISVITVIMDVIWIVNLVSDKVARIQGSRTAKCIVEKLTSCFFGLRCFYFSRSSFDSWEVLIQTTGAETMIIGLTDLKKLLLKFTWTRGLEKILFSSTGCQKPLHTSKQASAVQAYLVFCNRNVSLSSCCFKNHLVSPW